ncbi:MAG: chemotaxis protein CheW [Verrucomicrobiaceae bacterium]|nr:MAG: chemotaxis protein CheW [Verrucomicrobiaceae bacterium]
MTASRTTLTIKLDGDLFAIPAQCVREILDPIPITRVPGAPASTAGLVNVRGRIVPLADLRITFGLLLAPLGPESRIVVLERVSEGQADLVAIIADQVQAVSDLEVDDIHEAPKLGMRWPAELIEGVVQKDGAFIYLPNLHRVFDTQDASVASLATPEERTLS